MERAPIIRKMRPIRPGGPTFWGLIASKEEIDEGEVRNKLGWKLDFQPPIVHPPNLSDFSLADDAEIEIPVAKRCKVSSLGRH